MGPPVRSFVRVALATTAMHKNYPVRRGQELGAGGLGFVLGMPAGNFTEVQPAGWKTKPAGLEDPFECGLARTRCMRSRVGTLPSFVGAEPPDPG
jgi:hypothetical protein